MKILLAVSGGVDSMYLLARAPEFFPGSSFEVAHCNFSLRGKESDGDTEFVVESCAAMGIPCHVKHFDTKAYAGSNNISIEMAARTLRYSWFAEVCSMEGFDAIALAHNANDNAETLVLNLLRGSGTRGMRGMEAVSRREDVPGVEILRPMLGVERRDIVSWMKERSLPWREDSTNTACDCKRNIIRNRVFPIFESINPGFVRTLNRDMERIRQSDEIAEEFFRKRQTGLALTDDSISRVISVPALMESRHWEYLLYRLLDGEDINAAQLEDLKEALRARSGGKAFGGKTFGGIVTTGESIVVPPREDAPLKFNMEIIDVSDLRSVRQEKGALVLDRDRLHGEPLVRPWGEGDWMHPLGMKGRRKKVSDIMTDLKWPLTRKRKAMVIELDGRHVAALLCERIDEDLRITGSTQKVLRITIKD